MAKKFDISAAKVRVRKILPVLKKLYPDAKCALKHSNAIELLVATILSAQCTDKRVNIVTKTLFKKYTTAADWANAPIEQIEEDIRTTGFFRNKATNIQKACKTIISDYNGSVPNNMTELVTLGGVGRKTANVILGTIFNTPGIICDTHMKRLCRRLELSTNFKDPVKLEFDLMEIVAKKNWTLFSHLIVFHGRNICIARKPDCGNCAIAKCCPAADEPKLW